MNRPKRRVVGRTIRSNGNLYQRLEEARKQRAKVLATPTPANDARPVAGQQAAVPIDVPETAAKQPRPIIARRRPEAEKTKPVASVTPQKKRLPTLQLTNAIVAPPPQRKPKNNPFAYWHVALIAVTAALFGLAYATPVQNPPSVQDKAEALPASPETASASQIVLPQATDGLQVLNPAVLTSVSSNGLPATYGPLSKPEHGVSTVAPSLDVVGLFSTAPSIAAIDPAPSASVVALLEPLRDVAFVLPSENDLARLRVALHVPSFAPRRTVNTLIANADAAGLNVGAPTYVDFPIKATQVRYFHPTDKDAATLLAEAVGGISRDFTDFTPQPPAGFVEVWVSGHARRAQPERRAGLFDNLTRDLRQMGSDFRGALQSISR